MNDPVHVYRNAYPIESIQLGFLMLCISLPLFVLAIREADLIKFVISLLCLSIGGISFYSVECSCEKKHLPILTLTTDYISFNDKDVKISWSCVQKICIRFRKHGNSVLVVSYKDSEDFFALASEMSVRLKDLAVTQSALRDIFKKYKPIEKDFWDKLFTGPDD